MDAFAGQIKITRAAQVFGMRQMEAAGGLALKKRMRGIDKPRDFLPHLPFFQGGEDQKAHSDVNGSHAVSQRQALDSIPRLRVETRPRKMLSL